MPFIFRMSFARALAADRGAGSAPSRLASVALPWKTLRSVFFETYDRTCGSVRNGRGGTAVSAQRLFRVYSGSSFMRTRYSTVHVGDFHWFLALGSTRMTNRDLDAGLWQRAEHQLLAIRRDDDAMSRVVDILLDLVVAPQGCPRFVATSSQASLKLRLAGLATATSDLQACSSRSNGVVRVVSEYPSRANWCDWSIACGRPVGRSN
jgi:hypothetical protein